MQPPDATVLPFPGTAPPESTATPTPGGGPRRRPNTQDLTGRDLSGQDLRNVDLTDCDLTGATLIGADLRGACLFRARLDEADLTGAKLVGADLREAHGARCGFGGVDLSGADLTGSVFPYASFSQAKLVGASVVAAELPHARLVEADLTDCDLQRSNLAHATLRQATLSRASFRDVSLRGARIAHVFAFERADWVGTDLRDVDSCGAYDLRRFAHDQNYLEEFWERSDWNKVVYGFWWATSDCGRSMTRWTGWIAVLAVVYGLVYTQLPIDFGDNATWLSPLYFSVVTMTSLGFGDAVPTDVPSQVAVMSEVLWGYAMLGGLAALLSNKMARRAG